VGVLKNLLVGCVKTIKIKKVTTSRDDKGEGGDFLLGAVRSDAQKETAGQIPLRLDDLARKINKVTASPNDKGAGRHRCPLKPKYGLNGAPKAFVSVVISLLTRFRESTPRDHKGGGWRIHGEQLLNESRWVGQRPMRTPIEKSRKALHGLTSVRSSSRAARSGAGSEVGRRVARSTNTCTNQPSAARLPSLLNRPIP
jgi:hypothetical protein